MGIIVRIFEWSHYMETMNFHSRGGYDPDYFVIFWSKPHKCYIQKSKGPFKKSLNWSGIRFCIGIFTAIRAKSCIDYHLFIYISVMLLSWEVLYYRHERVSCALKALPKRLFPFHHVCNRMKYTATNLIKTVDKGCSTAKA